ncbi:unnamed protein product, partial [Cyprideis torosa]
VNKVILLGNCGRDPEVRYTQSSQAVATLSLATTDRWKDRNTGQDSERTEWHRLVFWGRLAEVVAQYVKKGQQLYIEGRLQTRKWQGQDGQDRYTTEIVVGEMQMLGGGKPSDTPANDDTAADPKAAQAYADASGGSAGPRYEAAKTGHPMQRMQQGIAALQDGEFPDD